MDSIVPLQQAKPLLLFDMTPELVTVIQTIALEAIKILGPAAIAAFATYRATAIQFEVKLQELGLANQFSARDRVYSYLKERLAKVDEDSQKLNDEIGRLLGFVVGATGGNEASKSITEFVELLGSFAQTTAKRVPLEVRGLLDDMRNSGLGGSAEFKALKEYEGFSPKNQGPTSFAELKAALLMLLEINNTMGICMRRLIGQQMAKAFSGYVQE